MLSEFLVAARLDAVGVFGYSDEDGTEAADLGDQVDEDEIESRRAALADLADELVTQRAEDRIGERVRVLVEEVAGQGDAEETVGRAAHQGPEVDGSVTLETRHDAVVGTFVDAVVTGSDGADLRAVA